MSETGVRLLSMLSLLQSHHCWTGEQLAERLGVSSRTVRTDVERLRDLGYDVRATRGVGGYRLGPDGASVPPLLLDSEEAVAVAVGLRTGVNCIIGGMEETSVRALAKLEQLLPSRLRHRVANLNRYTVPLPRSQPVPVVDPELLTRLAALCAGRERVRFTVDGSPREDGHDVEPYRLVSREHRWFLLGFDVLAEDWAVFEVDRIRLKVPTGPRFPARPLPAADVTAYLDAAVPRARWRHEATVTVHAPADQVAAVLLAAEGSVEPLDEHACRARLGGESVRSIAVVLTRLGLPFSVEDSPDLEAELRILAERLTVALDRR